MMAENELEFVLSVQWNVPALRIMLIIIKQAICFQTLFLLSNQNLDTENLTTL